MLVKAELKKLGIHFGAVELGSTELLSEINESLLTKLKINLLKSGLELLEDKKSILIEKIKHVIVEMIHYADDVPEINFSVYLSQKLQYDYAYLSNIFSEVQGINIRQYIIQHKIEKAKELLLYDNLNLSEIAFKLNYTSVSHLSRQFKKITGLSPTYFKKLKQKRNLSETL
jgi:YesN/AraC family two-component response regulator